jgi:hypothetical protein
MFCPLLFFFFLFYFVRSFKAVNFIFILFLSCFFWVHGSGAAQGLAHQYELYHLSHPFSLFCDGMFWDRSS